MNAKSFRKAGIVLSYSRQAMAPEIPDVHDVLYVLQISPQEVYFTFGRGNHATYIANVCLVAAVVANDILSMHPYDETRAKQIIARAILDLCPEEARCLFNHAFIEAKELAGEEVPPKGVPREQLLDMCKCACCIASTIPPDTFRFGPTTQTV